MRAGRQHKTAHSRTWSKRAAPIREKASSDEEGAVAGL
jgi:hypothetical protein